jgi:hypothetical protein
MILPREHRQLRWVCRSRFLAALCFVCMLPGCESLNLATPRLTFDDVSSETPAKMIPVWSDTVMSRPGQRGVRGFGGRIVFYGRETDEPVPVNGSLMVYGWDDTQGNLNQTPDRKYVVTAEELAGHLSQSTIGDSYSIWIPWDHAGSRHKRVTIVAKYVGQDGVELTSTPQRVVLPGPVPELLSQAQQKQAKPLIRPTQSQVEQAGYFTESTGVATTLEDSAIERSQSGHSALRQTQQTHRNGLPGTDVELLYSDDSRVEAGHGISAAHRMQTSTIPVTPGFAQRHFHSGDVVDLDSLDLQSTPEPKQPRRRTPVTPTWPEVRESAGRPTDQSVHQRSSTRSRPQSYGSQQTRRSVNELADPAIGEWQAVSGRASENDRHQTQTRLEFDYSRSQFQARTRPAGQPAGGHVRKQPHRSTWQRGLPPTPRSTPSTVAGVYDRQ